MGLTIRKYKDLVGPLYHYNGTAKLWFSPSAWLYLLETLDGLVPIHGVTGSLKIIGGKKTDMLIGWAVKKDFEKFMALIAECRRGDGFIEAPWDAIEELVLVAKREHKQILETAGDIGHGAHEHLEQIAKALIANDDGRLGELLAKWPEDPQSCNASIAAVSFLADHNVRFIDSERRVYSRELNVAGTMDGDALVDSCTREECSCQKYGPFKDKRVVLDYKTSNGTWSSYFGQMAVYRKARVEEAEFCGEKISYDGSVLLRIGKDDASEFECFFVMGDELYERHLELFKAALGLKIVLDVVEGWMDSIRDAVRVKEKAKRDAEKEAAHRIHCPKADDYKGKRLTKCFDDGTQCKACQAKYQEEHP